MQHLGKLSARFEAPGKVIFLGAFATEGMNMIQVNVKLHSILREVVGRPSLVIEAQNDSSVEDVLGKVFYQFKDSFQQKYQMGEGDWNLLKHFIIALNGMLLPNQSGLKTKVKEGDVVDIMEPMAGG